MTRSGAAAPHSVCSSGTNNRHHTVTRVLRLACEAAGIEIVECHRPLWEQTRDGASGHCAAPSPARMAGRYLALADAILQLAADTTLRHRLACNAQALMRKRLTPARQGERLTAILAEAVVQAAQ